MYSQTVDVSQEMMVAWGHAGTRAGGTRLKLEPHSTCRQPADGVASVDPDIGLVWMGAPSHNAGRRELASAAADQGKS